MRIKKRIQQEKKNKKMIKRIKNKRGKEDVEIKGINIKRTKRKRGRGRSRGRGRRGRALLPKSQNTWMRKHV